jgi:hypothetical protein
MSDLTSYRGPSQRLSSSGRVSLDYSGAEDIAAKRDALLGGRDAKFASLYAGDIASSVAAGNRIRDLVGALRSYGLPADERDAAPYALPEVRPSSIDNSATVDNDGAAFGWAPPEGPLQPPEPPEMPRPARLDGVLSKPERKKDDPGNPLFAQV